MRTERIAIPAAHPVFQGHFPGRPLVPGALLLDLILAAFGAPVARVASAKFQRPVLPGDTLVVRFTAAPRGPAVRFDCTRGDETVCSGVLLPAPARH
jgi:3-hydroxymyristoyl/3-hydroxydecanoyl-(acyl carrier protein) dehydratase